MSDAALKAVIDGYTRESGVRNLERELGSVVRKVARKKAEEKGKLPVKVTPQEAPVLSWDRPGLSRAPWSAGTGWGWPTASPGPRPAATS